MTQLPRPLAALLVSLSLMAGAGLTALAAPWPGGAGTPETQVPRGDNAPIEPELLRALLDSDPGDSFHVILDLRERANLGVASASAANEIEARARIVAALQSTASRSQAMLLPYLAGAQAAGHVQSYTPFWIVNAVAVEADRDTVLALAARPEIASVGLDHYRRWIDQSPMSSSPVSTGWGIERIRADQVWASLHISGTGAVVAGMDTGVDWFHPALKASYRGYNPHGPANHTYSWYDATPDGALYPVDGHGHGSHTMGTMVGQDGIGVAPGAQWIAVKVLNSQGYGYDSWIHAGFQWILAPGGDPAQAPDVLNNSWGNNNGALTTFQPDLQALRAASIFAAFANGNNGPGAGTVGSPASLPEAFSVGATDADDEVASFSSRGLSVWGDVRPHVAAPGVNVYSCLPGGAYGAKNGTSMATPHVAGVAALLRSVSPTLSITRMASLITGTAVPLGATQPNNDTGWGRVDAFAAVVALSHPGIISGTVTRAGAGTPVSGATVRATPHGGGSGGVDTTGLEGNYWLALVPNTFDLTASAFGYAPATHWGVTVVTDTVSEDDFSLTALPTGDLRGQITDRSTGLPLTAAVDVLDTPLTDTGSSYAFSLPAGAYTIRASRLGYRVVTASVSVTVGQTSVADLALPPAPSILLVDSGSWYYGSQASYFRQALDDLSYTCDEWRIKHLPGDLPAGTDLAPYDVVIWSAPRDAPGYIGAQHAITGYLSSGGRLLLSGQDVGFLDGGGAGMNLSAYYRDYLKAGYGSDNAPSRVLDGLAGDILAGLTLTITGSGGADNQGFPDEIGVADSDAAAPLLTYRGGGCGGLRAGICLGYRAVYLSFGLEGVNDRAARREVMARSLDWLTASLPAAGLELQPAAQMHIGLPGSIVTHAVRVRHLGQGGGTDTVSLALDGVTWPAQLSQPSLSLAPCTSATVVVSVTIPTATGWDARDVITLTATSAISPALARTAVITTKSPAPILLVDDDRWYPQEDKYEAALAGGGFHYDYWPTGQSSAGPGRGSPPSEVLQRYPLLVWFTGYDWYAPLTSAEEDALAAYLEGGGRLFLSSQDFLYYHQGDYFSRHYMGVVSYTESVTPTLARGVPENPIGDRLGPYSLSYPFTNWSDAVWPAPGCAVPFRDQSNRPVSLEHQEGAYKTLLFSFPHETLPQAARAGVMERAVGWLSWLGGSTFAADRGAVSGGDTLTYALVLRNDGPEAVTASLSNTLPLSLTMVPASLTGPAVYHSATRRVSWGGGLAAGEALTFTYRVTVASGISEVVNVALLGLEGQAIHFHRAAVVRVDAPDLSASAFRCAPTVTRPGRIVTCTLSLVNAGVVEATAAHADVSLPVNTSYVTGSLAWGGGGTAEILTDTVRWAGPLGVGARAVVTYQLALSTDPVQPPLYSTAFLGDGVGGAWERDAWVAVEPFRFYFPLVFDNVRLDAIRFR